MSSAPRLGDWPRAVDAFLTAWEQRPARLEAVHDLAVGLRERGLHHAAHQFTRLVANLRPLPVPDDLLFVAPWIYEWGMLFEYSITAYWCGEWDASIRACKRLLAIESLPEPHRRQTRANLQHAFRERVREAVGATASCTAQAAAHRNADPSPSSAGLLTSGSRWPLNHRGPALGGPSVLTVASLSYFFFFLPFFLALCLAACAFLPLTLALFTPPVEPGSAFGNWGHQRFR